jgi:hypothetical protein
MLTIPGPRRVVDLAVNVPVVVVGIVVRPIAVGARAGYDAGVHRLEAIGDVVVPAVLGAVLDRVDVAALLRDHVDMNEVVTEIDLVEIIQSSTASVSAGAVRGVRKQGLDADQAVVRLVDRLMFRHKPRQSPEGNGASAPEG